MEFTGVYHKTSEQMSYPLDEDRLIVNIKTGYDVKQVFIHYRSEERRVGKDAICDWSSDVCSSDLYTTKHQSR